VAYFCTLYGHKKVSQTEQLSADTSADYFSDYTRTNHVFGAGLDIDI
jgi:long-chain fatty acid transport protein